MAKQPVTDWEQQQIDDHMFADDESEFENDDNDTDFDLDCGLMSDGQCLQAGTEHCDFLCRNRMSELFAGSPAWRKKHNAE